MTIYQVLPRLWGRGKMSDWDMETLMYIKSLGVSHIWFTGIIRHASGKPYVKGDPGSPYAISDYYDVNPYLADDPGNRIMEFEDMVARAHSIGLKVIIDFVPNHVCADYSGDIPVCDYHDYDWSDTRKIDYNAPGTWDRMLQIIRFWAVKGVDGFRCDMVELVDVNFFNWMTANVRNEFSNIIFIAEVYGKDNYRKYLETGGFDLLYDKSGAYDSLMSVMNGGDIRALTWNWQWLSDMQPRMLNFLENHDERRLRNPDYAALAYASLFNNASFMIYFGQEIDERAEESGNGRTSIFDIVKLPSMDRLRHYIHNQTRGLNKNEKECLTRHREILNLSADIRDWANYDLLYCNSQTVFPFLRYAADGKKHKLSIGANTSAFLIACNFHDIEVSAEISIPEDAKKKCRLQRDSISISVKAHDCIILPL